MAGGIFPPYSYPWVDSVLSAIGAPLTSANRTFLINWAEHENTKATYNPLATTQPAPGATDLAGNPDHVKNYPTLAEGIAATAATLQNGYYPTILEALRSGQPGDYLVDNGNGKVAYDKIAAEMTKWGTNAGATLGDIVQALVNLGPDGNIRVTGGVVGLGPIAAIAGNAIVGGVVPDPINVLSSVAGSVASLLGALTNPRTLFKIGIVIGGGILLTVGLILLARSFSSE